MFCPLQAPRTDYRAGEHISRIMCQCPECAWYEPTAKICAALLMARVLVRIGANIIPDELPKN